MRRWIHHAQLELVPVLVPFQSYSDAADLVSPPAGAIAGRMWRDVTDFVSARGRPRLAVLTFDDGPYPVETPALAAQLSSLHVPADFFFIGSDAVRQPAIARRMAALGFEIGNHTLTHPDLAELDEGQQVWQIYAGRDVIHRTTGISTRYFRPPHGSYNADTFLAAQGQPPETVALWDVDPGDWRALTADQIVESARSQARAPAVILLHNGKDVTIEALPRIVDEYRRAGFTFVTLSELERRVPLDEINDPQKVQL